MTWGIVAGLVALLLLVAVLLALHPAPPFFSVRVIHFERGDVNALVEITNHTQTPLSFEYIAPSFKGRIDSLDPHGAQGTTVPAPTENGKSFRVKFWVTDKTTNAWQVRFAPLFKRVGIKLRPGTTLSFELTKPTGWMEP